MSGPQFAHIQTWSAKPNKAGQSIAQVIAEANRDPDFSLHVDAPLPPRVLMGNPATFAAEHEAHVAARSTRARMADGSERVRTIRSDRHTMASIIMSYPVPVSAINTDDSRQKLQEWEQRNLQWLRTKYGAQLRVVLAHDDEAHPHLHAWLLPDDPGANAITLHPGKVAKKMVEAQAKDDGCELREAVKLGNRALKVAMTVWQDEYHEAVGAPEGLTRSGPNRLRLSREQWKAQKATAVANAASLKRAETADEVADNIIGHAQAEASQILHDAQQAADRIQQKTEAVLSAVSALSDEIQIGTIRRENGKIVAAHPELIRPAMPEIRPAMNAVADLVMSMKDARKDLNQRAVDLDAREAEIEEKETFLSRQLAIVAKLRGELTEAVQSVRAWLSGRLLTVDERKAGVGIILQHRDALLPPEDPEESPRLGF